MAEKSGFEVSLARVASSVKLRIRMEERIVKATVRALIAKGWLLAVDDGDDYPIYDSNDFDAVMAALGHTDLDTLYARKESGEKPTGMGGEFDVFVRFVYGNDGWDVISDYTGSKDFEADLQPALDESKRCEEGLPELTLAQPETPKPAPELTHYIVMDTRPGYWGKGKTIADAIKNAKYLREGTRVRIIACDENAKITDMGGLEYDNRYIIGIGNLSRGNRITHLVFGSDAV